MVRVPRLLSFLVAFATLSLSTPTVAAAGTVTINFAGVWNFYNLPDEDPEFRSAAAALGIVNGTPLTFSMTLYDVDDADPSNGLYGVSSYRLNVGPALFQGSGGFFSDGHYSPVLSTGSIGSFLDDGFQLHGWLGRPPTVRGPIASWGGNVTTWPLVFLHMWLRSPTSDSEMGTLLTAVSVPETPTLMLVYACAIIVLVFQNSWVLRLRKRCLTLSTNSASSRLF